jgi:hypothetical protein
MVIQGPTVTTTAPTAVGASRGQQQQQQQQQIVVRGKRKKKVDPIHALRKIYNKQRKEVFGTVSKDKKQKISKFTERSKKESEPKVHRKQVSAYKKALLEKIRAFTKQFPPGNKIKETSTLRVLIAKLKTPSL